MNLMKKNPKNNRTVYCASFSFFNLNKKIKTRKEQKTVTFVSKFFFLQQHFIKYFKHLTTTTKIPSTS